MNENRILYADEYFAVLNKRPGEICENDGKNPGSKKLARELLIGGTSSFMQYAHRLDRPVSGCCLIALSREAAAASCALFANAQARKTYWAIAEIGRGAFCGGQSGFCENRLYFDKARAKARVADGEKAVPERARIKTASLSWKRLYGGERYVFLEITPHTGRTHQIRAQLSYLGSPIKGDVKYGARRSEKKQAGGGSAGIRLHARGLKFKHPFTGAIIDVTAPPPYRDALWTEFENAANQKGCAYDGA